MSYTLFVYWTHDGLEYNNSFDFTSRKDVLTHYHICEQFLTALFSNYGVEDFKLEVRCYE